MIALLQDLNLQRKDLDELRDKAAKLFAEWQQVNKGLLDNTEAAKRKIEETEATIKDLAIKAYQETGNRKPALGVEIKLFTELTYPIEAAFDWAMKHGVALTLDKKLFEKVAIPTGIDFVVIKQVPRAQIATNLDKVLGDK